MSPQLDTLEFAKILQATEPIIKGTMNQDLEASDKAFESMTDIIHQIFASKVSNADSYHTRQMAELLTRGLTGILMYGFIQQDHTTAIAFTSDAVRKLTDGVFAWYVAQSGLDKRLKDQDVRP